MLYKKHISRQFSLLEVSISVAITGILVGAMFSLISVASEASITSIDLIAKDVDADRSLTLLVKELETAVVETIVEPQLNTVPTTRAVFRKQENFIPPAGPGLKPTFIFSDEVVIRRVQEAPRGQPIGSNAPADILGNGIDDDGDGFIDEGSIVLEIGGVRRAILIENVTQLNFSRNSKPSMTINIEKVVRRKKQQLDENGVPTGVNFRSINISRTLYLANNQDFNEN